MAFVLSKKLILNSFIPHLLAKEIIQVGGVAEVANGCHGRLASDDLLGNLEKEPHIS